MANYRTIPTTLLETLSSSSDRVTRCKFIDWFSYSLKAACHISIPEKKAPWKEAIFIPDLILCTMPESTPFTRSDLRSSDKSDFLKTCRSYI